MKTRKLLTLVIAILAVAITNIQAQTLPSYVPTNGLVGFWGFNGTANDQSGNGNNGTVNGATLTTDRFGNSNSAYSFDGNDFIEIADNPTLNFTTQFSLSFYLKNNELTEGWFWCINKELWGNSGITTFIAQNILFYSKPEHAGWIVSTALSNQSWDLITITNDNGQSKIFKNGILIMSDIIPISNNAQSLIFGGRHDNNAVGTLNGFLDDIGIWNRVLTQTEITQLYTSSTSTQNLCTKTVQPYNVNVGDATHEGSTYVWSITPAAPNAVITGNGTNAITIDWTNVTDGSYRLQAIETSLEGCVSTAVAATINLSATPAPIAQPQTFCNNATIANLVATGTNLNWYAVLNGGTTLDTTTALTTGTYYVSQTIGTCESVRTAVAVIISPQVTPTFTPIASTCSGSNLTALPVTSNNGITGTWSPAINNNVTTTYTFTPDAGQCATTTTQTINITAPKVTSPISFVAPTTTVAALPSVTIGTQIWTSKNLDVSTYRDGTPIPQVTDPTQWENLTTGAWCYYDNNPANGEVYGKLYNWYAVAGIYDAASLNDPTLRKQFAPIGWHVPTTIDWADLTTFLGGDNIAGGKMKSTGTSLWVSPNADATNSSYFTGLPGGFRYNYGTSAYIGYFGIWWSSSELDTSYAWNRGLLLDYGNSNSFSVNKTSGYSVRLIKD